MTDFQGVVPFRSGSCRVILTDRFLGKLREYLLASDGPTQFSVGGIGRLGDDGLAELEARSLSIGYLSPEQQAGCWLTLGADPETASKDAKILATRIAPVTLAGAPAPPLVMVADPAGMVGGAVRLWIAPASAPYQPVVWRVPLPTPLAPRLARASAAAFAAAMLVRLTHGLQPQFLDLGSLLPMALAAVLTLPAALGLQRSSWAGKRLLDRPVESPEEQAAHAAGEASADVAGSSPGGAVMLSEAKHLQWPDRETLRSAQGDREKALANQAALSPSDRTGNSAARTAPVGAPTLFPTTRARRWRMEGHTWSDSASPRGAATPLLRLVWTRAAVQQLHGHVDRVVARRGHGDELEIVGVLLGRLGWDELGRRTGRVDAVELLEASTSGPFHVAIPAASLDAHRDAGWDILGLYHTHPPEAEIGITASEEDLQSFRRIADESQAMAIVDTDRRALGLYTWAVDERGMCILQAPEFVTLDWPAGQQPPFSNYSVLARTDPPAGGRSDLALEAEHLLRELMSLARRARPVLEALERRDGEGSRG